MLHICLCAQLYNQLLLFELLFFYTDHRISININIWNSFSCLLKKVRLNGSFMCVHACVLFFTTFEPLDQFSLNFIWTSYHWKPCHIHTFELFIITCSNMTSMWISELEGIIPSLNFGSWSCCDRSSDTIQLWVRPLCVECKQNTNSVLTFLFDKLQLLNLHNWACII
jgi:hypothetical protein